MLDEQHADAAPVADAADFAGERVDLLVVEARRGFVEQQQLGLDRQRARELDALPRRRTASSPTGR